MTVGNSSNRTLHSICGSLSIASSLMLDDRFSTLFADRKDMNKFHDALKTIYGPKSSGATTLLVADGSTLLTDKEAILKRWAAHSHLNIYIETYHAKIMAN